LGFGCRGGGGGGSSSSTAFGDRFDGGNGGSGGGTAVLVRLCPSSNVICAILAIEPLAGRERVIKHAARPEATPNPMPLPLPPGALLGLKILEPGGLILTDISDNLRCAEGVEVSVDAAVGVEGEVDVNGGEDDGGGGGGGEGVGEGRGSGRAGDCCCCCCCCCSLFRFCCKNLDALTILSRDVFRDGFAENASELL